jgi:hypothetical protein
MTGVWVVDSRTVDLTNETNKTLDIGVVKEVLHHRNQSTITVEPIDFGYYGHSNSSSK